MVLQNAFGDLASGDQIETLAVLLSALLTKMPFQDAGSGGARSFIVNSPNVNVTGISGTTTISSVLNQTQQGGLFSNADQYVQFGIAAQQLRSRITVT